MSVIKINHFFSSNDAQNDTLDPCYRNLIKLKMITIVNISRNLFPLLYIS